MKNPSCVRQAVCAYWVNWTAGSTAHAACAANKTATADALMPVATRHWETKSKPALRISARMSFAVVHAETRRKVLTVGYHHNRRCRVAIIQKMIAACLLSTKLRVYRLTTAIHSSRQVKYNATPTDGTEQLLLRRAIPIGNILSEEGIKRVAAAGCEQKGNQNVFSHRVTEITQMSSSWPKD